MGSNLLKSSAVRQVRHGATRCDGRGCRGAVRQVLCNRTVAPTARTTDADPWPPTWVMLPDAAALERLSLPDDGRQQQQLSDELPDQPGPHDTRTAARCQLPLPLLAIDGVTTGDTLEVLR